MKKIQLHAYAKINLTLDVTGRRPNGYHDVEMIMQQISLCDEVTVSWEAGSVRRGNPDQTVESDPAGIQIQLTVSRPDLPADSSNLAWKAAEEMIAEFGGPAGGNAKAAAGTEAARGTANAAAGTEAARGTARDAADTEAAGRTARDAADTEAAGRTAKAAASTDAVGRTAKDAASTDAAGRTAKDAASTEVAGGVLTIDIQKQIPMAAGLAGGSSNCAAVLHAINQLWKLNLSVKELCRIGARLGSDVPFCIMGQAAAEEALQESFADDPDACHCALATGTGTDLKPLTGLDSFIVLSKPAIGVSTAEVYRGIDNEGIPRHPDNNAVISAICENNYKVLEEKMVNVLENFALKRYPIIVYTKNIMSDLCQSAGIPNCVMMSGSGPTVFCLCEELSKAQQICEVMKARNPESFVAKTTGAGQAS